MTGIEPFHLSVPQAELDELNRRLDATRWPERETVDDWSQGAPKAAVQALCDHWRHRYDWRRCEAMLNGFGQYRTEIEGLGVHFLHRPSPEPDALPIILTHGWPGSVIEFCKVIGPLCDPAAHGGERRDAFHVVVPSLPGYGFSQKPGEAGWGVRRIARAWTTLMQRLGYQRFVAQGGDWGAAVTTALALLAPPACAAIHLNMPLAFPTEADARSKSAEDQAAVAALKAYTQVENGYARQQATRPQTLGYGLVDSPVGQAAWIFEKFRGWADCAGDPFNTFTADEMLDNIMLYWLPGAGASSARLYWESMDTGFDLPPVRTPTAVSLFPRELFKPPRSWVERQYTDVFYWNEPDRGGHFAAFEQPELFVQEVRAAFRTLR